jgi:hypothetical protein
MPSAPWSVPPVSPVRALVAYSGRAAADLLDPTANYVRPDGQLVGTGAQIIRGELLTGPWVTASNQCDGMSTWTGAQTITTLGTAESTCNDWTSTNGVSPYGIGYSILSFWQFYQNSCDTTEFQYNLYCIEP